jgi:hypothetical protein
LADVTYPRPGVTLFHGLELHEPETGELVLRCRMLEAAWSGSRLVLDAEQPELSAAHLPDVWQWLSRQLRQGPATGAQQLLIADCDLTVRNAAGAITYTNFHGDADWTAEHPRAEVSFRVAGLEMRHPARLSVERVRDDHQHSTRFTLDTGGTPLPSALLAPLVDGREWLGDSCTINGSLWATERAAGWEGELTGVLTNIDLDRFVSDHFPRRLSGNAVLTLAEARFHQGRLMMAEGNLHATEGAISRELLESGVAALKLGAPEQRVSVPDMAGYEELAFSFHLDDSGLTLTGECQSERGVMLVRNGQPLWWQPVEQPQPMVNLLRALAPASQFQVPATAEAVWLMQGLPIPPVMAPHGRRGQSAPPRGRLKVVRQDEPPLR